MEDVKSPEISSNELERAISSLVRGVDLKTMSVGSVRRDLAAKFNTSQEYMDERTDEIKGLILKVLRQIEEEQKVKTEATVKQEKRKLDDQPLSTVLSEETAKTDQEEEKQNPPKKVAKLQSEIMTKRHFLENAGNLELKLQLAESVLATPRTFSTGSCGWSSNAKIKLRVGDQEVFCQVGFNCTVVGSKNWKES
ncbi:hypothetical protein BEWA_022920 [Theileria equi strain WA]|uniref:DEK-C domain-containing protein n=1 Tax=Theileria equi strain WA TaxID=1537102 RepID=L0AX37_THEEQ|nr:hypothetical protein BEWA_022920 [Theileria equi strain WA]AFZ79444.1 hypothetical protein BEWA_022920 [Theileria equi strain WA]|eukprot:XP_004829110.1 hypothetical protein BEWA_022920 [Theileria equi strain WA]